MVGRGVLYAANGLQYGTQNRYDFLGQCYYWLFFICRMVAKADEAGWIKQRLFYRLHHYFAADAICRADDLVSRRESKRRNYRPMPYQALPC